MDRDRGHLGHRRATNACRRPVETALSRRLKRKQRVELIEFYFAKHDVMRPLALAFRRRAYMTDLINLEITDPARVIVPLMAANVCFIARQIVYPEDRALPETFSGYTISLSRTSDTAQQVGISRVIDELFVVFFSLFFFFFFSFSVFYFFPCFLVSKRCIEFNVDVPFRK